MRADVIPQLADGAEVLAAIDVPDTVAVSVLIPNERGLDNALAQRDALRRDQLLPRRPRETHNRKNVNRSIEESLTGLERVLGARARGGPALRGRDLGRLRLPLRGPRARGARVRDRRSAASTPAAEEVGFGDTTGMANPRQVGPFFAAAREALGADVELTAHFHNTRGQGLANVLAALEQGIDSFESSFGELGGCPVPPGATGNIATEDLVSMLHEMGIETGIALERLLEASRAVREVLGRPARVSRAHGRPGRLARPSALRIRSRALAGIWWSETAWSRIGLASS